MRITITILLSSIILGACMGYEEVPVESDYSYQGKFRDYQTFNFMRSGFEDSSTHNEIIQEAITYRMELRGYEYTEQKPRLLVSYRIFYDSLLFQGYEQPELETWIKEGAMEEEEEMQPKKYKLTQGTLLVLFYDSYQEKAIWQGYASGVLGGGLLSNRMHLRRIVRSIFDKYNVLAKGFIMEEENN